MTTENDQTNQIQVQIRPAGTHEIVALGDAPYVHIELVLPDADDIPEGATHVEAGYKITIGGGLDNTDGMPRSTVGMLRTIADTLEADLNEDGNLSSMEADVAEDNEEQA